MADFRPRRRKKVCALCEGKTLDFLNKEDMEKYINEKGKILPRRVTGNCAEHQRFISKQIKRVRAVALLPYTK
jgi:small subunit ribosomal protein S18